MKRGLDHRTQPIPPFQVSAPIRPADEKNAVPYLIDTQFMNRGLEFYAFFQSDVFVLKDTLHR